jgi:arginine-tRNA-protein transferase
MHIFRSEMGLNYAAYSFGYAIYGQSEISSDGQKLLSKGFLPYTGDKLDKKDVYYLARSLRIHLDPLELSSENRRILRKFEPSGVKVQLHPASEFNWKEEDTHFCLTYANERFSTSFSATRLDRIRQHQHLTHYLEIHIDGKRKALIFLHCGSEGWHYWFAFFYLDTKRPLGKFAMLRSAQLADEQGLSHLYIGTCYGAHSLYKVRDFKSISFFTGSEWSTDKKKLKAWCKSDENCELIDRLKRE